MNTCLRLRGYLAPSRSSESLNFYCRSPETNLLGFHVKDSFLQNDVSTITLYSIYRVFTGSRKYS